jgi:hypothetical protein
MDCWFIDIDTLRVAGFDTSRHLGVASIAQSFRYRGYPAFVFPLCLPVGDLLLRYPLTTYVA